MRTTISLTAVRGRPRGLRCRQLVAMACGLVLLTPQAHRAQAAAGSEILPNCASTSLQACRLPTPSAEMLEPRTKGHAIAIWMEGDRFYVAMRDPPDGTMLCCQFTLPLERVPGTRYAVAAVRVPIEAPRPFDVKLMAGGKALLQQTWHPQTLGAAEKALVAGSMLNVELGLSGPHSLQRRISVYLPHGYRTDPKRYVLYLADGQAAVSLALKADELIKGGRLPPLMIVGIWNDPALRDREYLPGFEGGYPAFIAHKRFVQDIVATYAESELGAPSNPQKRIFAGASNGAAWALAMASDADFPADRVIALSPLWTPITQQISLRSTQMVFVGAGEAESGPEPILRGLAAGPARICAKTVPGGHSADVWSKLYHEALLWLGTSGYECNSPRLAHDVL